MSTPILDFLHNYAADDDKARLHMPGHKGTPYLGVEPYDITEVKGADVLFCPEGIIAASEAEATVLFGSARTIYSCGGSTASILAAMWLLRCYAADQGRAPLVLANRNVHQAFVSGLAQTGLEVSWMCDTDADVLRCPLTPMALECRLRGMPFAPIAVYVTSPDYLGNMLSIAALAEVCHRYGTLLMVDGAHGAYLRFLPTPCHPIGLGADICCDSAHKTLPALTGAAYLHFGKDCPPFFAANAKDAMLTVSSTSPSYLMMASLDLVNAKVCDVRYRQRLAAAVSMTAAARARLIEASWQCVGTEALKLCLYTPMRGYMGTEVAERLREVDVEVEFADRDYLVMMVSADTPPAHLDRAVDCLCAMPLLSPLSIGEGLPALPPVSLSVRDAYLSPAESVPIERCTGRVLHFLHVTCPPAIPPVVPGEVLTEEVIAYLKAMGYASLSVVRER